MDENFLHTTKEAMPTRWRNRIEATVLAAMFVGTTVGMCLLTSNANGHGISEEQAVADAPSLIPLMELDKQSNDAPVELSGNEVLPVSHDNPLDHKKAKILSLFFVAIGLIFILGAR